MFVSTWDIVSLLFSLWPQYPPPVPSHLLIGKYWLPYSRVDITWAAQRELNRGSVKRLDEIDNQLETIGTLLGEMENRVDGSGKRLTKLSKRLCDIEDMFVKMEASLSKKWVRKPGQDSQSTGYSGSQEVPQVCIYDLEFLGNLVFTWVEFLGIQSINR